MLTKEKLSMICAYPSNAEHRIIKILWEKYSGCTNIDSIQNDTGLTRKALTNVHIRKSPYIGYEPKTGIVKLYRKGKDIVDSLKISKNVYESESIAQLCFSLFWYVNPEMDYSTMSGYVKQWGKLKGKPIGGFLVDKIKHYSYYKKEIRKWLIAYGRVSG